MLCTPTVSGGDPRKGVKCVASGKKGKSAGLVAFVAIEWSLINSPAYHDLSGSAVKLLVAATGKPKMHYRDPRVLNTPFEFTYSEGLRLGISRRTFHRVICELIEHGFMDCRTKGGLRGFAKTSSTFCLSIRWKKYGQPDFQKKSFQPEII